LGVIRWWGLPGEGLFLIALMLSLVFLWLDIRGSRARTSADAA
jgi:hypothetical protein